MKGTIHGKVNKIFFETTQRMIYKPKSTDKWSTKLSTEGESRNISSIPDCRLIALGDGTVSRSHTSKSMIKLMV